MIADAAGDFFYASGNGVYEIVDDGGYVNPVFPVSPIASLNGAEVAPQAGLIRDAAGDIFGTTENGGTDNDGTVFEIAKTSAPAMPPPRRRWSASPAPTGKTPRAGLIMDAASGDLFGTTSTVRTTTAALPSGSSTVFEIVKTSTGYSNTPIILTDFSASAGWAIGGLVANADGDLFGTTLQGGTSGNGTASDPGDGTVYELTNTGFQVPAPPPPMLSGGGNSVSFTPDGAPVAIDLGLLVTDSGSSTLAGLPRLRSSRTSSPATC